MLYDNDTFEHDGHKFRFRTDYDPYKGAPWEEHDGRGVVSDWTSRSKAPGEMILAKDGSFRRYYDFAETVKIARRDGWNAAPYSDTETRGQRAHKAAMADFNRLRDWCNDRWNWCGVIVDLLNDDGDVIEGESASLWGIESDAGDYFDEVARELAEEILHRLEDALAA